MRIMSNELEDAQRAQRAAEEMLGFVLLAVGEPVVVPKELLDNGIPTGATISINELVDENAFVFAVEVDSEQ